jgi:hypothetical protein
MVSITKPAINLRSELASLKKDPGANPSLARFNFSNLVINGDGNTITGWDDLSTGTGTAASVDGEFEIVRFNSSNRGILEQGPKTLVGKQYNIKVEKVSGPIISVGVGTSSGSFGLLLEQLSIGINNYSFVAETSVSYLNFRGISDGTVYFDNVSLWEADPADDAPWLRLPFGYRVMQGENIHPQASVQRDGSLLFPEDFTEIWRNGQSFIKPNTAPGASTKFSVVGYAAV